MTYQPSFESSATEIRTDMATVHPRGQWIRQQFNSWNDVVDFIRRNSSRLEFFGFRGQADSRWLLFAPLYRDWGESDDYETALVMRREWTWDQHESHERGMLRDFEKGCDGLLGDFEGNAPQDPNGWWALGRHHGLRGPLLDWTSSAFIAMYFAVSDWSSAQRCAIFCIARDVVKKVNNLLERDGNNRYGLDIIECRVSPHRRAIAQGSFYTRAPSYWDLESLIVEKLDNIGEGPLLCRIEFPMDEGKQASCLAFCRPWG